MSDGTKGAEEMINTDSQSHEKERKKIHLGLGKIVGFLTRTPENFILAEVPFLVHGSFVFVVHKGPAQS